MKTSRLVSLFFLFLLASLLTACGGQITESWNGLSLNPDGTTVYLAGGSQIYTIDPNTGTEKARIPAEADNKIHFYSPPLILPDGSLVAGSYNHSLYRLNPGNQQPVWVFDQATDRYIATPVLAGETILAPSADNTLYALSLDGKVKWTFEATHGLWASPVVDDDRVYQASTDHYIYALRLDNGELLWKTEDLGGEMVAQPALGPDGTLYIGAFGSKVDDPQKGSKLVAINAQDGSQLWTIPTRGWVWATPILVDNILYFGDQEGYIYAVDAEQQNTVWQVQPDTSENRAIVGAPLVIEDTIYIANKAGNLYALDLTNGSQRWMQTIGGQIYTTPAASGDSILVAPMNFEALVVAVDRNGSRRWSFTPAK